MPRKTMRELRDELLAKIEAIRTAPVIDPEAPPGYMRPEFGEAEIKRRADALSELLEQFLQDAASDDEITQRRLKNRRQRQC